MTRVKGGPSGHLRHKKVIKYNKGNFGTRSRLFRRANETMLKSMWYATRDRKNRKRDLRKLWIIRINAASVGLSVFIGTEYEHQTLMALANLVNQCEPYGIPVMAVTAVGKELDQRKEARYLSLACRICAEYGARAGGHAQYGIEVLLR